MLLSFKELKKREVVNIADGRSLGKITDMKLEFPKAVLRGIVVLDRRNSGFLCIFRRNEIYIEDKNIVKIGGDVILVDIKGANCAEPAVINMNGNKKPPKVPPCPPPCPPLFPPCPPNKPPCPSPCPPDLAEKAENFAAGTEDFTFSAFSGGEEDFEDY